MSLLILSYHVSCDAPQALTSANAFVSVADPQSLRGSKMQAGCSPCSGNFWIPPHRMTPNAQNAAALRLVLLDKVRVLQAA